MLEPLDGDHFYTGDYIESMEQTPNYVDWIVGFLRPYLGGVSAKFGAGIGTIAEQIVDQVSSLELIEPSVQLADQLCSRFENSDKTRVIYSTVENRLGEDDIGNYDTIILVNVLEHIEDDGFTLGKLKEVLNPGGNLFLYVPALPILYSEFDKLVGHHRRYSRSSLRRQLEELGFRIKLIRSVDILGILPWFVMYTIFGKMSLGASGVKFYDRIGVPLTKFWEIFSHHPLERISSWWPKTLPSNPWFPM